MATVWFTVMIKGRVEKTKNVAVVLLHVCISRQRWAVWKKPEKGRLYVAVERLGRTLLNCKVTVWYKDFLHVFFSLGSDLLSKIMSVFACLSTDLWDGT